MASKHTGTGTPGRSPGPPRKASRPKAGEPGVKPNRPKPSAPDKKSV
ncbi:MAG: hypothetical protein GX856_03315 [Gammaproteobacteria bacterium]|jgi:hypothetical protein|nr:hypothetical protein [Gammaproteobacteria bacterium]